MTMLTKEILLAQKAQYEKAVMQAQADYNMAQGAVEAIGGLLMLNSQLETEKAIAEAEGSQPAEEGVEA